jgi:hypothetical protein
MSTDTELTAAEKAVLKKAMSKCGRAGGSVTSAAKKIASKANGQLGGRRPLDMQKAEEAAYNLLMQGVKDGVPNKELKRLVARWVKSAGKYVGVIRSRWSTKFGNIEEHLPT